MGETTGKGRTILVAVDESMESTYAPFRCLRKFVAEGGGGDTLVLLYAKPMPSSYTAMDGTGCAFSADITATMERYNNVVAGCLLAKATKMCRDFGDVKVETRVEDGLSRFKFRSCIGCGRTLPGSVSRHCAQNIKCPVLIVKRPKSA